MADSPGTPAATSDVDVGSSPGHESRSFAPTLDDDDMRGEEATPHDGGEKEKTRSGRKEGQAVGKIRHLKKDDGDPLWRIDIQHDFLKAVFDDETEVFTNSYDDTLPKQNFADLYIDTMARSSKTSRVLRDKLLTDREAAKGMAMVCLLVNMGRMNTTLNFFPEMRAQLRTYHAIPSLQAHQDPHAYKQLQDAPRLKSILKGGADDRDEPGSLSPIKNKDPPRTNPVNLVFLMCAEAQKIAELHFPDHQEFHDLIMKVKFSSQSRARAFLWLMWLYLESDFTEEGCEENPFGAGVDYGLNVANQGIPRLEVLTEEEQALENVDTPEELEFGRAKQKTRAKILEADQAYLTERETKRGKAARVPLPDEGPAILPRIRPSKNESDMDSTRSTPPPRAKGKAAAQMGSFRRSGFPVTQHWEVSSPPPPKANEGGVGTRKPRPPTAHQLAVERNRNQRVEYILDKGLRKEYHKARKARKREGAIFQAYKRLQAADEPFEDSDDETTGSNRALDAANSGPYRDRGPGGLSRLVTERDDYGEQFAAYAAAIRRTNRRLGRWKESSASLGVIAPVRQARTEEHNEHGHLGDATMGDADVEDMDATIAFDDATMALDEAGDEGTDDGLL